ncbi:MAG: chloramphenicol acetyltransferase CAT [Clostridia bacterium]|nr:CatA-like O-acetyltransferase [Lachnospiraceae bacterium]NCC00026.1 chloramphenicol acetyltransferase CAT [Clostridia bacterium]NCD01870.1 chloramphenicol acetyltransferase CAT [Clostridia bacterium]
MAFHLIDMDTWERREHFKYYLNLVKTSYTLTANLHITQLVEEIKKRGLRFYPVFLYITATAVNRQKEMRMAYDSEKRLGYWDECHPSYTIFHKDDCTFSDIWTTYDSDFSVFYKNCLQDMETYKDIKGIKPKPGKPDNFTPISCLPWLSYTAHSNDTPVTSPLFFPVVLFGKYFEQNGEILIPFSAYLQHAVSDGYHTSLFINTVQEIAEDYKNWMNI